MPDLIQSSSDTTISFKTSEASAVQPAIDTLRKHNIVIQSAGFKRPSLEDLFMQVVDTNNGAKPGAISGAKASSRPLNKPTKGGANS